MTAPIPLLAGSGGGRHPFLIPAVGLPLWLALYLLLPAMADAIVGLLPGTVAGEAFTEAVRFFVFEAPKVLLLLVLIVFLVGIVRTFFSPERTRRLLEKRSPFLGNVLASLLGIVTPFCSCSAVPLFLGFVQAGIPLGVTFSFLIAAPMINEVAVVLLFGLFGWQTALVYVSTGLLISITSGSIIGRMRVERYVEEWVYQVRASGEGAVEERPSPGERIRAGVDAMHSVVGRVWPYVVLGIAVGAWIHGFVPEDFMADIMGRSAWWSVPLSVLIGIPLYSNAAGIIPIIQALLEKGVSLGTALAFMMSVIGLSLPEAIILRKVIKLPLIVLFMGVVGSGILVVGYLFNIIYG